MLEDDKCYEKMESGKGIVNSKGGGCNFYTKR